MKKVLTVLTVLLLSSLERWACLRRNPATRVESGDTLWALAQKFDSHCGQTARPKSGDYSGPTRRGPNAKRAGGNLFGAITWSNLGITSSPWQSSIAYH